MENTKEKSILEETEELLFNELKELSDSSVNFNKKINNLPIIDRKIKAANVIVQIENFKERQYMNRTNRLEARRRASEADK